MDAQRPILTPCRKICVVDPVARICEGCGRTLDEIANWLAYSPAERAAIMRLLPERREGLALASKLDGRAAPANCGGAFGRKSLLTQAPSCGGRIVPRSGVVGAAPRPGVRSACFVQLMIDGAVDANSRNSSSGLRPERAIPPSPPKTQRQAARTTGMGVVS